MIALEYVMEHGDKVKGTVIAAVIGEGRFGTELSYAVKTDEGILRGRMGLTEKPFNNEPEREGTWRKLNAFGLGLPRLQNGKPGFAGYEKIRGREVLLTVKVRQHDGREYTEAQYIEPLSAVKPLSAAMQLELFGAPIANTHAPNEESASLPPGDDLPF